MSCLRRPRASLVWLLVLSCAAGAESDSQGADPPDILLVVTDDQRADQFGFTGKFPFLDGHTPHLDQLAAMSAHFVDCFVTTSLCSPSRASILTGTYAHRHGVWHNLIKEDPDPAVATFPEQLQAMGYETAFIGKWHMKDTAQPRKGFDYWLSFKGQGVYHNPRLNENGEELRAKGYVTDLLTDYAVRWLRRERKGPRCLILAHKALHEPFEPAPRHAETFTEQVTIRRKTLDQFRTLLAVDESIGRLRETLEDLNQLDKTLWIYTSDNGFFRGEQGRQTGKKTMYEASIRVPLLIHYPPWVTEGRKIDAMALNLDLAPTILEMAGAPIPESVQGRSLVPHLRGEACDDWRDAFLYEFFHHPKAKVRTMLGVRNQRYKYILFPETPEERLYDLREDPQELLNLAPEPESAASLAAMRKSLKQLKEEVEFCYPEGTAKPSTETTEGR